MGVKCPSCGFESAQGALFCDLCKEPFQKPKKAVPASAAKIMEELAKDLPKEALAKIPAHLMMDEEKVPVVKPWMRYAAWGFLFFWLAVAGIMTGLMWLKWQGVKNNTGVSVPVTIPDRR